MHRFGSTARAGRCGLSVSMVAPNDVALVQAIESHTAVKWSVLEVDNTKVAEIVVQVNTVRREGDVELGLKDWERRGRSTLGRKSMRGGTLTVNLIYQTTRKCATNGHYMSVHIKM